MSKYKFKRVQKAKIEIEEDIPTTCNDSTDPDEASKTRDFKINNNNDFNPFEEDEDEKKSSLFNFRSFIKSKEKEKDVVEKLDEIYSADVMSVEEIKENLSDGKKIDLGRVFGDKKTEVEEGDTEEEEDFDGDKDTYDIEEETAPIEEDIYDTDDGEDFVPPVKVKKEKQEKEVFEYTSATQNEEITEKYRKKGQAISLSFILSLVFTLLLIYLETKAFPHPVWLMPGKFGVLFLLLDLQLVFLSAICVFPYLINGAKALFTWKPNKNSVTFIAFCVSVIQIALHLIFNKFDSSVSLYSSVFSLCATITLLSAYVDARREHIAFRVLAKAKTKYCVSELDETSSEYEKFSEYLPRDLGMYKIDKSDFISDFFKISSKPSPYDEAYKISIPLVVLASLIFSIITSIISKGAGFTGALNSFTVLFMLALPLSSLFTVSLPFFITTLRLARRESAIIGESSIADYANTSLISFADTDVFHEKGIKVTSIKTYGKSRIDTTFVTAARIFKLAGGPLKEVFNRSVIDTTSDSSGDELVSVTSTGIKAVIDGEDVYVGNKDYMEANGFGYYNDSIDTAFETGNGRIMYVATGGEISAKFYIKYALGKNFKAILDSFCSIGICMAINSRDPNLDTKFLTQILKDDNYPIVVVKREEVPSKDENEPREKTSCGIVSSSSVPNMLRTFLASDKLSRLISMNTIVKYISLVFAVTVLVILFLGGHSHEKVTPLFIMLYQLVWSLPVIGSSLFH